MEIDGAGHDEPLTVIGVLANLGKRRRQKPLGRPKYLDQVDTSRSDRHELGVFAVNTPEFLDDRLRG